MAGCHDQIKYLYISVVYEMKAAQLTRNNDVRGCTEVMSVKADNFLQKIRDLQFYLCLRKKPNVIQNNTSLEFLFIIPDQQSRLVFLNRVKACKGEYVWLRKRVIIYHKVRKGGAEAWQQSYSRGAKQKVSEQKLYQYSSLLYSCPVLTPLYDAPQLAFYHTFQKTIVANHLSNLYRLTSHISSEASDS